MRGRRVIPDMYQRDVGLQGSVHIPVLDRFMDLYIYACWMHEHTVKMGNRMAEWKKSQILNIPSVPKQ